MAVGTGDRHGTIVARLRGGWRSRVVAVAQHAAPATAGVVVSFGINIASFNLGRNAPLKDAMALIGVDSEINSNVMENVKKLESIVTVNNLIFNIK